jgi:hypothetical protein
MQTRHKKLERANIATKQLQQRRQSKCIAILAYTAVAMQAQYTMRNPENQMHFDTDSEPIGIDNQCTVAEFLIASRILMDPSLTQIKYPM